MSRNPEDIMREIWSQFLATNPGPEFKPWDELSELERSVFRALVASSNPKAKP